MNEESILKVQYGGVHYKKRSIQPWHIWEAYDMNGWEASAVKYLLRYKDKGKPIEDLYKCLHNIQYLILLEERKHNETQTNVQDQANEGQSSEVFASMVQDIRRSSECPTKVCSATGTI